ncbi:MAG TPA: aminotransferase DegT, partial [Campylobacterales bacterium]|nr:aminotransferase DegT [Campylobacterales bacterium]
MEKCNMYKNVVDFIQELYQTKDFLPLHEPRFFGNEKKYVNEAIDSTFVSSVGKYVTQLEQMVAN